MSSQLDLFHGITDSKFPQYHMENPHIYDAFKNYTWELIRAGRNYSASKAIIERMRWDSWIRGNDAYKINNNYAPLYSRMFENEHPAYKDFFRKRKSKFDNMNLQSKSI
jgi:hypothetical protein